MKLSSEQKEQIKIATIANFGISELNETEMLDMCKPFLRCVGYLKQFDPDFRKTDDILRAYLISQVYLQEKYDFSQDEVFVLNTEYPNKFDARVPDWLQTCETSELTWLIESGITPGLVLKRYPNGIKTYFVLGFDALNDLDSELFERSSKPEFKSLF